MGGNKKLLLGVIKALTGFFASAVITALVTGQPLSGLTRLSVAWHAFAHGLAPAWAFFVALLAVLYGFYYVWTHPPRWLSKGTVHFVPSVDGCTWAGAGGGKMQVALMGTLTYEGEGTLTILKAFLEGTQPAIDMGAQVYGIWGRPGWVKVQGVDLEAHSEHRVFLHLIVNPSVGTQGQMLQRDVLLRDKYNRDFSIGPVDFRYTGER